jgi:hypothetical protein
MVTGTAGNSSFPTTTAYNRCQTQLAAVEMQKPQDFQGFFNFPPFLGQLVSTLRQQRSHCDSSTKPVQTGPLRPHFQHRAGHSGSVFCSGSMGWPGSTIFSTIFIR